MSTTKPVILLAEDDENDVFFMKRALQKASVDFPLHVVKDGQEALDYLSGAGKFSDRHQHPLPALILLDLKMPFLNGFDVLAWINTQPSLKSIPVVVLTSSSEERDRQKAAQFGAKSYFVKPPTPDMLQQAMGLLNSSHENTTISS
jgi:CheY-like chemotaxis protein